MQMTDTPRIHRLQHCSLAARSHIPVEMHSRVTWQHGGNTRVRVPICKLFIYVLLHYITYLVLHASVRDLPSQLQWAPNPSHPSSYRSQVCRALETARRFMTPTM